jgi:DNA polymerase-3 subunit alpha
VGTGVVESIISCRKDKGAYTDFADYLSKVDAVACNKKVIESLIKAGAFDSLGHTRRGLLTVHAEAVDHAVETKRAEAVGQFDLFAFDDEPAATFGPSLTVPVEEWDKQVLLSFEREMLGLYVSDHPLLGVEQALSQLADCTIAALNQTDAVADQATVTVGGLVTGMALKTSRNSGERYAMLTLEDLEGAVEVMVFPGVYRQVATLLAEDAILLVKGRVRRDETVTINALEITAPDLSPDEVHGPVVVALPVQRCTPPVVERLKDVLRTHPGTTEVHLRLLAAAGHTTLRLGADVRVTPSPALKGDLKALLGPSCLV